MKCWTKCISMAIVKTASRSVAFKVARLRDAITQDQDEFIARNANFEDVDVMANDKAILKDIMLTCILLIKKLKLKFRRFDQRFVDLSVKLFEVL